VDRSLQAVSKPPRILSDSQNGQELVKKEVIIPRLGSSDESDEVKILRWLKKQGEMVKTGEPLLEVETDKVNVEIEASDSGLLKEIRAKEGQTARFNSVVAVIETAD